MTLIIAGHELEKDPWGEVWAQKDSTDANNNRKANGLFAVADSVITSMGSQGLIPILNGHRKIHELSIKLWKPYFVGEYFQGYKSTYLETSCFIAYAGSTLTASHAINLVTEHLRKLEISYAHNPSQSTGNYVVNRHCEYNLLKDNKNPSLWANDMFLDNDFVGILNADYLANIIEHSLNTALNSVRKYCISQEAFRNMHTDFLAGIYCPTNDTHHLYKFTMESKRNNGVIEVFVNRQEIPKNKVAVIGLRTQFENEAQAHFDASIEKGSSTGKELYKFINSAIDSISSSGNFAIDYPSVHIAYKKGVFEKVNFTKEKMDTSVCNIEIE